MMRVGVPRELKPQEHRVALTPAGARALVAAGSRVLVETCAGVGADFADDAYRDAGAIVTDRDEVWSGSDLIVKVKEPVAEEYPLLRDDLVLFTYLHLAANPGLTDALVQSGISALAYETVEDRSGRLPLLAPMSEVAGRLAPQVGAQALERRNGGRGVLLGGVTGIGPANVIVLGGGVAGANAALIAAGMQARVTVIEKSLTRARELETFMPRNVCVIVAQAGEIEQHLVGCDLVIGAVLLPGARAPMLVERPMLALLNPRAAIVDIAIDQGGCCETSAPRTHEDPLYVVDGVVHYTVTNMPGIVPVSSTRALTNATFPLIMTLASHGLDRASDIEPSLGSGVNVRNGEVVHPGVSAAFASQQ